MEYIDNGFLIKKTLEFAVKNEYVPEDYTNLMEISRMGVEWDTENEDGSQVFNAIRWYSRLVSNVIREHGKTVIVPTVQDFFEHVIGEEKASEWVQTLIKEDPYVARDLGLIPEPKELQIQSEKL